MAPSQRPRRALERAVRLVEARNDSAQLVVIQAGEVPAYHFITYGFILGELVRRVTGTPVREFMTT